MERYLTTNGNSWHLYINKHLVQLLGITEDERLVRFEIRDKVLYVNKILNEEKEIYKNLLCKKLVRKASSFGLNLPLSILHMIEVNPETDMIDFEINGQTLIIKKAG